MLDLKMLRLVTYGLCGLGATATLSVYLSIFVRSGGTLVAYSAMFCGWGLTPYVASLAISHACRQSQIAAIASLCGSLLVSAIGLFAITAVHRNAMILVQDPDALNCVGPIFELGAPLVQLAVLVPVGLLITGAEVVRRNTWARGG